MQPCFMAFVPCLLCVLDSKHFAISLDEIAHEAGGKQKTHEARSVSDRILTSNRERSSEHVCAVGVI